MSRSHRGKLREASSITFKDYGKDGAEANRPSTNPKGSVIEVVLPGVTTQDQLFEVAFNYERKLCPGCPLAAVALFSGCSTFLNYYTALNGDQGALRAYPEATPETWYEQAKCSPKNIPGSFRRKSFEGFYEDTSDNSVLPAELLAKPIPLTATETKE